MQATSAKLFRNLSQVRSEVKCSFTLLVFSYRPAALCWPPGSPRMGATCIAEGLETFFSSFKEDSYS